MTRKRPDDALFNARPYRRRSGRNKIALEKSLKALRTAGALEPVDAVRVAALRTLAETMDDEADGEDPSLFSLTGGARTLFELFNLLAAGSNVSSSALDDLLAAMSAPPGNAPP